MAKSKKRKKQMSKGRDKKEKKLPLIDALEN